jgi:hypothetical protein
MGGKRSNKEVGDDFFNAMKSKDFEPTHQTGFVGVALVVSCLPACKY